jgi:hypothetical protein
MIKAFVNGVEGGSLNLQKAGDATVNLILLDRNNAPQDITGDTVTAEFYDTSDRRNTPVRSKTGALTTAAAGYSILTLLPADLDFGPGRFFLFIKYTASGGDIEYGRTHTDVQVG